MREPTIEIPLKYVYAALNVAVITILLGVPWIAYDAMGGVYFYYAVMGFVTFVLYVVPVGYRLLRVGVKWGDCGGKDAEKFAEDPLEVRDDADLRDNGTLERGYRI